MVESNCSGHTRCGHTCGANADRSEEGGMLSKASKAAGSPSLCGTLPRSLDAWNENASDCQLLCRRLSMSRRYELLAQAHPNLWQTFVSRRNLLVAADEQGVFSPLR